MPSGQPDMDAGRLYKGMNLVVTIKERRVTYWRRRIAFWLLFLAARVWGVGLEVIDD